MRERLLAGVGLVRATFGLATILTIVTAIVAARIGPAVAGGLGDVEALRVGAAEDLEAALRQGGSGVTFEVTQRNTLYAKSDGPRIAVTAPDDQTKVVAFVDELYVNTIFSRGGITADVFWMEMRGVQDQSADFDKAPFFARVLERDGTIWRDDGVGWYVTDESPGVGMDPATARLLPTLLRELKDSVALDAGIVDGKVSPRLNAKSEPASFPGVIAADGMAFTEPSFDVECWFDDQGRLVRLIASARNLNQTTFDLVAETVVTITYGPPGDPPTPDPTRAPEVAPTSEPESAEVPS
jgi:hypothetical protein